MKYPLIILLSTLLFNAQAQKLSAIDFDAIKQDVTAQGNNNYQALVKRSIAKDTTLTLDNFKHLYYGQVFQTTYSPYSSRINADKGMKLINQNDIQGGEKIIDSCLSANPANMDALYYKAFLLFKQGKKSETGYYVKAFQKILVSILASGDGKSDQTALVVTSVPDEYQILKIMQVKLISQSLSPAQCDILTIEREATPGQAKMYFNVQKPLEALTKSLKH